MDYKLPRVTEYFIRTNLYFVGHNYLITNNNNNNNNYLEVVPVVVGALGVVTKRLDTWLEKLGVTIRTGLLQKSALLGTARILRKLLES